MESSDIEAFARLIVLEPTVNRLLIAKDGPVGGNWRRLEFLSLIICSVEAFCFHLVCRGSIFRIKELPFAVQIGYGLGKR